jgi:hypothetical protein
MFEVRWMKGFEDIREIRGMYTAQLRLTIEYFIIGDSPLISQSFTANGTFTNLPFEWPLRT